MRQESQPGTLGAGFEGLKRHRAFAPPLSTFEPLPATLDRPESAELDHLALLYSSDEELASALATFVTDGSRAGEPVLVVASEKHEALFRDCLALSASDQLDSLSFAGDVGRYRRPAMMVACYRKLFDDCFASGASHVRLIGNLDLGDSIDEQMACARYESVLNKAFGDTAVSILCPYDTRQLPEATLRQVECTHPNLLTAVGRRASSSFLDPAKLVRGFGPGHLLLEDSDPVLDTEMDRAGGIPRQAVRMALSPANLPPERLSDFVTAFNEVATNAVVHGTGTVRVHVWADSGIAVCAVSDEGTSFDDALAGYVPPSLSQVSEGGMGLWISRQLCDEVDIVPSEEGLTVRLVMRA